MQTLTKKQWRRKTKVGILGCWIWIMQTLTKKQWRRKTKVGILLISGCPIKPKDCGDVGT
jgi:hypothetical protein